MSGTNGTVKNCRSLNSWADGINLNNTTAATGLGSNLSAVNNYIRGSCDDAIAVNAQNGEGTSGNMVNTVISCNTLVAPAGASCISVYGGRNTTVQNNLACDPSSGYGIHGGTFGTAGNPLESAVIENNYVVRAPGRGCVGALSLAQNANVSFTGNTVLNSLGNAVYLYSSTSTFTGNMIYHPAFKGIYIPSGQTGSATFHSNTVQGMNAGQNAFQNDSSGTFPVTSSGNYGF
jgi:hypothetical protein